MEKIYYLIKRVTQLLLVILPVFFHNQLFTYIDHACSYIGFETTIIHIKGNKRSGIDTPYLRKYINKSTLCNNPFYLKNILMQNPWIDKLSLKILLPNTINIEIEEKKPTIIWNGTILDQHAQIIIKDSQKEFDHLIKISGHNAEKNIILLLDKIEQLYPTLKSHIVEAVYIGNRRWNLITNKNQLILLPENNLDHALENIKNINVIQINYKKINLKNHNRIFLSE